MRSNEVRGRGLKWFFPFFAILVLIPWPVAYAYDPGNVVAGQDAVRIEIAEPPAEPSSVVFARQRGGIAAPVELFRVDSIGYSGDIALTLYLTNAQKLTKCYSYLILKVQIYVESNGGEWKKASQCDGKPVPDTFITLRNGLVSFHLEGLAKYKVAIDSGSFYCIGTEVDGGSVSPEFYLTAD